MGSVSYAYSEEELRQKVDQRIALAGDVLVQEFARGAGVGFSCMVADGKVHLPFQWQRIREVDPRGSASSCRKAVALDSSIEDWSRRLITAIGFTGIAMVEFKKSDARHNSNGDQWTPVGFVATSDFRRSGLPALLDRLVVKRYGALQIACAITPALPVVV